MSDHESQLILRDRYRRRPNEFALRAFGFETWSRQREILIAVAKALHGKGPEQIAFKSGHKVGKSSSAALIAFWFVTLWPGAQVILTANTHEQISRSIWPEIRRLYAVARDRGTPLAGRCYRSPGHGYKIDPDDPKRGGIVAVSPDDPINLQGFTGYPVIFIIDEASGYSRELYDTIRGAMAMGGVVLALGNPTHNDGWFYDAFNMKADQWSTHTIASYEGPNFLPQNIGADVEAVKGLASYKWLIRNLGIELGTDFTIETPLNEVLDFVTEHDENRWICQRVLGIFAPDSSGTIISSNLADKARQRWPDLPWKGRLQIGVDPAWLGQDESVAAPRRGHKIGEMLRWQGIDGPQLALNILEIIHDERRKSGDNLERPIVVVDTIGIGVSCYDTLKRLCEEHNFDVCGINSSMPSDEDASRYSNMRAQLHFNLRDFLRDGGGVPDDPKLRRELTAPKSIADSKNRYAVEKKKDVKKRLGHSPDSFDACALAVVEADGDDDEHVWG